MAPSAIFTTEEYQIALKDSLQSISHHTLASVENHGAWKSKHLIGAALKSRVEAIDHDTCDVGDEDAFFIADLGEVYRQHLRWKKNLARVKPHYGTHAFAVAAEDFLLTCIQRSNATQTRRSCVL
jgi:ornithine decarboxylase